MGVLNVGSCGCTAETPACRRRPIAWVPWLAIWCLYCQGRRRDVDLGIYGKCDPLSYLKILVRHELLTLDIAASKRLFNGSWCGEQAAIAARSC